MFYRYFVPYRGVNSTWQRNGPPQQTCVCGVILSNLVTELVKQSIYATCLPNLYNQVSQTYIAPAYFFGYACAWFTILLYAKAFGGVFENVEGVSGCEWYCSVRKVVYCIIPTAEILSINTKHRPVWCHLTPYLRYTFRVWCRCVIKYVVLATRSKP